MFILNAFLKLLGVLLILLAFVALYQAKATAQEAQPAVLACDAERTIPAVLEQLKNSGLGLNSVLLTGEKADKFFAVMVHRLGPPPIDFVPDTFLIVSGQFIPNAYVGLAANGCLKEVYTISPTLLQELIIEAQE